MTRAKIQELLTRAKNFVRFDPCDIESVAELCEQHEKAMEELKDRAEGHQWERDHMLNAKNPCDCESCKLVRVYYGAEEPK